MLGPMQPIHLQAPWQVVLFIWMLAALTVLPNKTFKFMSTLIMGLYPFGFLMLVYLSETGLLPVALMLFWLLPY
jgi:hypothetical protein